MVEISAGLLVDLVRFVNMEDVFSIMVVEIVLVKPMKAVKEDIAYQTDASLVLQGQIALLVQIVLKAGNVQTADVKEIAGLHAHQEDIVLNTLLVHLLDGELEDVTADLTILYL